MKDLTVDLINKEEIDLVRVLGQIYELLIIDCHHIQEAHFEQLD